MNPKKATLHLADDHHGTKNYPFLAGPEGQGFKNMLYSLVYLKERLADMGIDIATRDINPPEDSLLVFCWDNPHTLTAQKKEGQIWSLLINDPPMYCPESWGPAYHERFDFVFTFDETLVDNKKYFYYPFAIDTDFFSPPEIPTEQEFDARRLATFVSHAIQRFPDPNPGSTLHERYKTIEWYGRNHPDDFRFYGGTFISRNYYFGFRGIGMVQKVVPTSLIRWAARKAQSDLIKVYGGELAPLEKFDVIQKYKFYYCYENTVGINGYVCEKIYDCFYCGIVPVYWGAPNIKELIPYECFIDGRQFRTQDELYSFLRAMDYATYRTYLEKAKEFLGSEAMERFTVESSISHVLRPIQGRLGTRLEESHQTST